MDRPGEDLIKQLGDVTREIGVAIRSVLMVQSPIAATADQLPQASTHLGDISKMTEEGTHRVMALTEEIQADRDSLIKVLDEVEHTVTTGTTNGRVKEKLATAKGMLARDDHRLLEIMTTLAFQDLVAQRIKKVGSILADIEHQLLESLVVFGARHDTTAEQQSGRTRQLLNELEASRHTSLKQDLVDEILGEVGFQGGSSGENQEPSGDAKP